MIKNMKISVVMMINIVERIVMKIIKQYLGTLRQVNLNHILYLLFVFFFCIYEYRGKTSVTVTFARAILET